MKNAALLGLAGVALLFSCEYDHGVEPIRTRIEGEIIFTGGPPPEDVAEVRVVATKRFPPENLTSDVIFSDRIKYSRGDDYQEPDRITYGMPAEPGTYPAVGVLWRKGGEEWDLTNVLGIYTGSDPLSFSPEEVVVDNDNPVADSINIRASWELARRDASIEGEITFLGDWPEDTEILALAMFPIIPKSTVDFLTVKALDIAIPLFRDEPFHYRTPVSSGTYKFISVFWKGKTTSIFDIRAIGFYHCANDSLQPRTVEVATDSTATGIDITVDFSTLPGGIRYKQEEAPCPGAGNGR